MASLREPSPHTRDAVAADLPAIVAIYNATIWVVDDEAGAICAWLSFSDFHPRPAYHPTAEVSVYVTESHRRRGLAGFLLRQAIERAPGFGLKVLVGLVWDHNEPSLRLFGRHEFRRWGHLPRVALLHGVERDLVIVGRRVAP
jgi:phosphinothricin acetyltransferase